MARLDSARDEQREEALLRWILYEAILPNPKAKLLDQVGEIMRLRHFHPHRASVLRLD